MNFINNLLFNKYDIPKKICLFIVFVLLGAMAGCATTSPNVPFDFANIASIQKIAVLARQYEVKCPAKWGILSTISSSNTRQPMVYVMGGGPIGGGSSAPSGGGVSVGFGFSVSYPVDIKKETLQLQKVIGDFDMTDVLRTKFEKELQGIGQFEVIDGNVSEGIYKECCADSMQILFVKRKDNAELEKQFEEKLKKRLQADTIVYLDIGEWGVQKVGVIQFPKGNLSLKVAATMKRTKDGTILWKTIIPLSFAGEKENRKTLEEFLSDNASLLHEKLEDLTSTMARLLLKDLQGEKKSDNEKASSL